MIYILIGAYFSGVWVATIMTIYIISTSPITNPTHKYWAFGVITLWPLLVLEFIILPPAMEWLQYQISKFHN